MNHTAAREQKRQIRRAFGPDALEVLTNRDQAIKALQHRLEQTEAEVAFLRKASAEHWPKMDERLLQVEGRCKIQEKHLLGVLQEVGLALDARLFAWSLWARLRWLFLGR